MTLKLSFSVHQAVSTGSTPEWDENVAWAFDNPPKGQKLHISCKNKSKLGKVTIYLSRTTLTVFYDLFSNFRAVVVYLSVSFSLNLIEFFWKSDNSDWPGGYARNSFWRVHTPAREQKRPSKPWNWVPVVQQISSISSIGFC